MAVFLIKTILWPEALPRVREFCKEQKIRVTKMEMDALFTNQANIRVSGDTKRVANKVREFIWDELNGGAWCEITKVKK